MIFEEMIKAQFGFKHGFGRHYFTLYSMVLGLEASCVFEFGIGLSTHVMLDALEHVGGRLISCANMCPSYIGMTEEMLCSHNWVHLYGKSQDVLSEIVLDGLGMSGLDLVLHDGSHVPDVVMSDLQLILPRMKQNGLVLIHDTEYEYHGLMDSVEKVLRDVKHECVTLPYGCGLTIVRICEDFGYGSVELTWKKQKK